MKIPTSPLLFTLALSTTSLAAPISSSGRHELSPTPDHGDFEPRSPSVNSPLLGNHSRGDDGWGMRPSQMPGKLGRRWGLKRQIPNVQQIPVPAQGLSNTAAGATQGQVNINGLAPGGVLDEPNGLTAGTPIGGIVNAAGGVIAGTPVGGVVNAAGGLTAGTPLGGIVSAAGTPLGGIVNTAGGLVSGTPVGGIVNTAGGVVAGTPLGGIFGGLQSGNPLGGVVGTVGGLANGTPVGGVVNTVGGLTSGTPLGGIVGGLTSGNPAGAASGLFGSIGLGTVGGVVGSVSGVPFLGSVAGAIGSLSTNGETPPPPNQITTEQAQQAIPNQEMSIVANLGGGKYLTSTGQILAIPETAPIPNPPIPSTPDVSAQTPVRYIQIGSQVVPINAAGQIIPSNGLMPINYLEGGSDQPDNSTNPLGAFEASSNPDPTLPDAYTQNSGQVYDPNAIPTDQADAMTLVAQAMSGESGGNSVGMERVNEPASTNTPAQGNGRWYNDGGADRNWGGRGDWNSWPSQSSSSWAQPTATSMSGTAVFDPWATGTESATSTFASASASATAGSGSDDDWGAWQSATSVPMQTGGASDGLA